MARFCDFILNFIYIDSNLAAFNAVFRFEHL